MDIHDIADEAVDEALYEQELRDYHWEIERAVRRREWQQLLRSRRLLKAYPAEMAR